MEPLTISMKFRIAFAVIGVVVGLSIALVFGFVYENIDTAVWGLLSGSLSGLFHHRTIAQGWPSG